MFPWPFWRHRWFRSWDLTDLDADLAIRKGSACGALVLKSHEIPVFYPLRSYFCWWNLDFLLVFTSKIHVGRRWPVARGQKTWVFAEAAIEWCPQFHHGFCMNFNGNSRSLKWRYVSTIYGQFRFLKWPLLMMWPCQTASFNCVLSFSDTSKSLDIEIWQQQTTHRT